MKYASSSSSSSGSSSSEEAEHIGEILRGTGMNKKYSKVFAKANIEDLDDAMDLTERSLKKLGITSSTDRKKILKAIAKAANSSSEESSSESSDSETSESEDDEFNEIEEKLDSLGLKKYSRKFRQSGITTLKAARRLSDSKLKDIGVESSRTRSKIINVFNPPKPSPSKSLKKRNSGDSKTKQTKQRTDRDIIHKALKKAGYGPLIIKFDENDVNTLTQAKNLSPARLRTMGIDSITARTAILDAFTSSSLANLSDGSDSEGSGKSKGSSSSRSKKKKDSLGKDESSNPICKALARVNLNKHADKILGRVTSIREAQELGHDQLRDIGIDNIGQREMMMEVFAEADWKCIYCQTWNEHRKTCLVCQKTYRKAKTVVEGEEGDDGHKFVMDEKVKYIGRFRPTTRIKYGEKGTIHRVLPDDHYMVKFINKEKKTVQIRLQQAELAKTK